ncbi:unnamed protein product [Adineta steineri]|nr:unnamed protein product [Adineta steineri]
MWDVIVNDIIPTMTIIVCSLTLLLRVIYQKSRMHQTIHWRTHRKMTIQLLSISLLYLFIYMPKMLIEFLHLCGVPNYVGKDFMSYAEFFAYYGNLLLPLVCAGSMPQLKKRILKLFPCCQRHIQTVTPSLHIVTCFEDLDNEHFYEIFEYFDYISSYEIFFNLNQRFRNLFINLPHPIKIKFSSLSKSIFKSAYENIILPYQHKIQVLYLSNPFIIDFFLLSNPLIQKFIHLQTFIIEDIESKYLENLLNDLLLLPNLSTLVIMCKHHYVSNRNNLYKQIFRLSTLKYCKLSLNPGKMFEYVSREGSDRISPNTETNRFSPITHLVIEDTIVLYELSALLSHVPRLRHLSINRLCTSRLDVQPNICPIVSQKLTHVYLHLGNVYFDVFELLIKNILHQVQVLHISTPADPKYLIANRWKSLILFYMPYLQIFDIDYHVYTSRVNGVIFRNLIDQFQSSFWIERQWFFAFHMKVIGNYCQIYFYSTDPYRKRQFTFDLELIKTTTRSTKQIQMNSVRHLELENENCIINSTNYFPNVTQLTCKENLYEETNYISSNILNRIFPLEQITELNIYLCDSYFKDLIQLIISLPNIHKLCLCGRKFQNDFDLLQQVDTFHNKIKDVTISIQCTFENMKLLVNLFPQLQHLTISMLKGCFVEILQYLLSKNNEKTPYLNSIWLTGFNRSLSEKIMAVLQSKKIRHVDSMPNSSHDIRLWCETILPSTNNNCTVEYDGHLLEEDQVIEIKGKLYKVEDCALQRAYNACGMYLLQMVSIACNVIQNEKHKVPSKRRVRKSLRRKLLTEACCETLCTVAEMIRYCPSH